MFAGFLELDVQMSNSTSRETKVQGTIFNVLNIINIHRHFNNDKETCLMKYFDGREVLTITIYHAYETILEMLEVVTTGKP
jgi:hypothetical protein